MWKISFQFQGRKFDGWGCPNRFRDLMNESQNFQQVRIIYTATRVETLKRNIFFFKRAVSLKKDHLRREHPLLRRGGGKSIIKSPSATRVMRPEVCR